MNQYIWFTIKCSPRDEETLYFNKQRDLLSINLDDVPTERVNHFLRYMKSKTEKYAYKWNYACDVKPETTTRDLPSASGNDIDEKPFSLGLEENIEVPVDDDLKVDEKDEPSSGPLGIRTPRAPRICRKRKPGGVRCDSVVFKRGLCPYHYSSWKSKNPYA